MTVCQPFVPERLDVVETFKKGDRVFPAGSRLYQQGVPCTELYNLLDGWVMLYRLLPSGRRQVLDFALPGAFLGWQPNAMGRLLHDAVCLTDVAVCVFPRAPFPSLMRERPELAERLAWLQARDTISAHDHLTNIGKRSARARLSHFLLELYARVEHRYSVVNGEGIELPLTQEHIADALGLTNIYVNKTLRTLREDGLVRLGRGWLQILNPSELAVIGEFDAKASHLY